VSLSIGCCGIDLELRPNQIEDEQSWNTRCPACGKQYWLELIGQEDTVVELHLVPENGKWIMEVEGNQIK
jgi:hypothetical protein